MRNIIYSTNTESKKFQIVTKAEKKTLMKAAFNACGLLHRSKDWWVTDYKNKILSWWDLSGFQELDEPAVAEEEDVIATFQVNNYDKRSFQHQPRSLKLVFVRKLNLGHLQMYSQGDKPDFKEKNDAIGALNLFFAKHTLAPERRDTFQAGQNGFFQKPGWERMLTVGKDKELKDTARGKVACRGYSYGVRSAMGHMLLNVNSATGLLYDTMTVADYLEVDPDNNSEQDLIGVGVWVGFQTEFC